MSISLPEAILKYVIKSNTAPILLVEPKELYNDFEAGRRGIIDFGGINDAEGDHVTIDMHVEPDVAFFRFDKDRT